MTSLDDLIRDAVDAHLKRSGTSGWRFGRDVLGDPGFAASLKRGRRLGLKSADKVLAAMGAAPIGPAFRREVEAFLTHSRTKPYVFGEQAAGDPSFVERLRRGVSFRLATVDRVRAWMAGHADAACRAAMARAAEGAALLERGAGTDCDTQGETTMKNGERPHLSARQAAAWLGVSERTLHRFREQGGGPDHYRFGHRFLYRMEDLKRWAAEHRVRVADGGDGRRAA
jgi:hypothetical protein